MTDHSDGNWHGWNGGECPVHPKSIVKGLEECGAIWTAEAGDCDWKSMRGGFRVVKKYREPRVWSVLLAPDGSLISLDKRRIATEDRIIRVREVLE